MFSAINSLQKHLIEIKKYQILEQKSSIIFCIALVEVYISFTVTVPKNELILLFSLIENALSIGGVMFVGLWTAMVLRNVMIKMNCIFESR